MRLYVEPSPAGGYFVRVRGEAAPLSRHDTEEEAEEALAAYRHGLARQDASEYVQLDDGSEVLIRPLRPEDKPLLAEGFQHLSTDTVYKRFLQPRGALTPGELAALTEIDHVDHEAFGAIDPVTGQGVGVARYVRDAERPHVAEPAVVVVDAWQGRGLGAKLLRRLCDHATANGIRIFSAPLLASNEAIIALFEQFGEVIGKREEGPVLELDVELPVHTDAPDHALRHAAAGRVRGRWK